jgi:hypothetical protein
VRELDERLGLEGLIAEERGGDHPPWDQRGESPAAVASGTATCRGIQTRRPVAARRHALAMPAAARP